MKEKTRIIDLKQFIKYCFGKIFIIVPVVLVCMALLVALNYEEQKETVEKSKKDILSSIMSQNHSAYYYRNVKFTDADPPKGAYNSKAAIFVSLNYNDIESNSSIDSGVYTEKIGNDILDIIVNPETLEEIINELNLRKYPEMDNLSTERFMWMINKNFLGAHVVKIVVSDVDPDRAKLIADKLVEKAIVNLKEYPIITDFKVMSYPTLPEDKGLFSTSTDDVQTSVSKGDMLKYAVVGGILGICLMIVILFIIFVTCDAVRTENDLAFADIPQLVSINRKKIDYKRIAYSIDIGDNKQKVLFVSVDKRIKAEEFVSDVKNEMKFINKNLKIDFAEDFVNISDALSKAKEADGIVYLVKYGKTKMRDLVNAKNSMDRFGIDNIGGLIL